MNTKTDTTRMETNVWFVSRDCHVIFGFNGYLGDIPVYRGLYLVKDQLNILQVGPGVYAAQIIDPEDLLESVESMKRPRVSSDIAALDIEVDFKHDACRLHPVQRTYHTLAAPEYDALLAKGLELIRWRETCAEIHPLWQRASATTPTRDNE